MKKPFILNNVLVEYIYNIYPIFCHIDFALAYRLWTFLVQQ